MYCVEPFFWLPTKPGARPTTGCYDANPQCISKRCPSSKVVGTISCVVCVYVCVCVFVRRECVCVMLPSVRSTTLSYFFARVRASHGFFVSSGRQLRVLSRGLCMYLVVWNWRDSIY